MDGEGKFAPHLIEEIYNLEDALVVAGFLNSFIRHADVLKIANLAQIVNVIAPVLTQGDRVLIQSIFYPFEMISRRREGISLRVVTNGPSYEGRTNGAVPYVDASAILDNRQLKVFLTNRNRDEIADVTIVLADGACVSRESAEILTGPDVKASNSFETPEVIKARPFKAITIKDGQVHCKLPPLSFAAMTLNLK
jgi:alpha-N-arabinofuranosidase